MNTIRSLVRWGTLYILVGILIAAIYWEQTISVSQGDHDLIAIGILIGFSWVMNLWIKAHPTNFLAGGFCESDINDKESKHHLKMNSH
jgi:hypothetical protein